jgi:hypothetical protein
MTSHILCLVKKFAEDILPTHGDCPNCQKELIWGELIQASKLRHKQVLEKVNGVIERDEANEEDIDSGQEENDMDNDSINIPEEQEEEEYITDGEGEFEIQENGKVVKRPSDESSVIPATPLKRRKINFLQDEEEDDLHYDTIHEDSVVDKDNQNGKVRTNHANGYNISASKKNKKDSSAYVLLDEEEIMMESLGDEYDIAENYSKITEKESGRDTIEIGDEGNDSDSSTSTVINLT